MWKDLKYLVAYIAPIAAFAGIYFKGIWSFGSIYVGFVMIPILEQFLPLSPENVATEEEQSRSKRLLFDWLLYLNIPMLYLLIIYYFSTIQQGGLALYEQIGLTLNVGLIVGTVGINVAHELGHRSNVWEQRLAKLLLLTGLYQHFYIEHNRGHHKHVGTPEDPSSARLNENVYAFWLRSVSGAYRNAWKLERTRLEKEGKPFWSWHNEMVRFALAQALYLMLIALLFSPYMVWYALAIALIGVLLLESVNYIEHYGLRRKKLESGRYERVQPWHSWNSDHELGRIFLYELTRHSDHHFKASRKYQILRHFDDSPQLPLGYPASIILALLPPVWFGIMNGRIRKLETKG